MTESPTKKLRQRRAALGALQGDPESPVAGTLYGRRQRLQAELDRALSATEGRSLSDLAGSRPLGTAVYHPSTAGRSVAAVRQELRLVDEQIEAVQQSIDEIDRQLDGPNRKARRHE